MHAASVDANAEVGPDGSDDAAVERIVAGVAHDFGNLLAVITNYLSLASRRVEDPTTSDLLEQVRVAAKRAARLNRQLHDLGECGSLTVQPVAVNDLVREVQPVLDESLDDAWELRLDLGDEPITALGSRTGLEMALRHLVDNAREAMPDGGPIEIATRRIGDAHDSPVELSVSDQGSGMAPDVVERAAEPRFSTRPTGQVGGLGLTIVDRVVGTLGGDLQIESTVGTGTTVRLRLSGGPIGG